MKRGFLYIKLTIMLVFLISIGAFFAVFIDMHPLNINSALTGIDIIKLPESIKEYSSVLKLLSFVMPGMKTTLEGLLMVISRCFIGIIIVSFLGGLLTLAIRSKKGLIASIAAVAINLSLAGYMSVRLNNDLESFKMTALTYIERISSLLGNSIPLKGDINVQELIGGGIILWISTQLLVLIISIVGMIIREEKA